MTHAEFHAAVKRIANGDYFSARVETTETSDGDIQIRWKLEWEG